jgi:DNA invertase Pin-like site-specific DNA recombinase
MEQKNYLGYVRVSTKGQIFGTSLDVQTNAIINYSKNNNINLVQPIYRDEGMSAYKSRPKLDAMMKRLFDDPNINGVICYDLTRFGRSTIDLLQKFQQMKDAYKDFVMVKDNVDTSTKTGKLLMGMLSLIADFEAETIRERMASGKEYAREFGTKSGKPMHRPQIEIDWDMVMKMRPHLSWTYIAKQLGISSQTLIKRAKEKGQ